MKFLLGLIATTFLYTSYAQTQQGSTSETELKNKKEEKTSKWSNTLSISFNTDTKTTDDGTKSYETLYTNSLTYKVNEDLKLTGIVKVNKEVSNGFEEELADTKISMSKAAVDIPGDMKYAASLATILPTSESSKRNQELNFALEVNNILVKPLSDKTSFTYVNRITKNFHEYEVSRTNRANTELKLSQFFILGYAITDKTSISSTLIHGYSWSYSGKRRNPTYLTNIEIGHSVNENLSVAIGTLQGGSIFDRENGPDETISFYDENATSLYAEAALKF